MNFFRFGPQDLPLPGIGQFVKALSHPLWLSGFAIEPLISQGLSVPDIHGFLSTETGNEYAKESSVIHFLQVGEVAFVP